MVLALFAVGVLVLLLLVTGLAIRHLLSDVKKSSRYKIDHRFTEEDVLRHDVPATCYGYESGRGEQFRGMGALVLTSDLLWFSKLGSDATLEIPMSTITDVTIVREFRGELGEMPMIRIATHDNGLHDRIAFWVDVPIEWRIAILNLSQHPGT